MLVGLTIFCFSCLKVCLNNKNVCAYQMKTCAENMPYLTKCIYKYDLFQQFKARKNRDNVKGRQTKVTPGGRGHYFGFICTYLLCFSVMVEYIL